MYQVGFCVYRRSYVIWSPVIVDRRTSSAKSSASHLAGPWKIGIHRTSAAYQDHSQAPSGPIFAQMVTSTLASHIKYSCYVNCCSNSNTPLFHQTKNTGIRKALPRTQLGQNRESSECATTSMPAPSHRTTLAHKLPQPCGIRTKTSSFKLG